MIFDGRKLALGILDRTKARAENLDQRPQIVVVVANETAATRSFLRVKEKRAADAGCVLKVLRFPESTTTTDLRTVVGSVEAQSIVVQLPLPPGVNTEEVCDTIPLAQDADVLSTAARAAFETDMPGALVPPVVGAVAEILKYGFVDARGKRATVIGTGALVGKPCAVWLARIGAEVTVLDIDTNREKFALALTTADIIVSGTGSPHLIKPTMIKDGVVLIDAGTSESLGRMVGDADPACAAHCSLFTPVPGGVGPLAVAKLFENTLILAERKPFIS